MWNLFARVWRLENALVFLVLSLPALAADVKLAWDANTESDLAGYKVYFGLAPRVYSAPTNVGKVTSYTVSGLAPGTYYFAVTAYNTAGLESGYSNEVSTTIAPSGASTPSIAITSPTSAGTFSTSSSVLAVSGTASDKVSVDSVTWVNSLGGSGAASGTTSWTATVPLQNGANLITVTARNRAGNSASASITVTCIPGTTGDINGDGKVDVLDLQILTNAILGVSQPGKGDLNGDGKVDVLDLQILTNIILVAGAKP